MPDEVTLDVTTIEENVTVETTAGDVVEIQVVAPTGPAGATGPAGPNSVTSATTSDGTANLSLADLEVVGGELYTNGDYSNIYTQGATAHIFTLGSGAEIYTEGELAQIYTTGASAQIYTAGAGATIGTQGANATIYTQGANATISTAGSAAHIQTSHASAAVKSTNFAAVESGGASLVDGSMQPCLTWSAGGRNLTIPSGTATTFNTTSYSYGTGAAAAHRTALGVVSNADLLSSVYEWSKATADYSATNVGTGISSTATNVMQLNTLATAGSSALLRSDANDFRAWQKYSATRQAVDWSKKTMHFVRISSDAFSGADTIFRIYLGLPFALTTVQDLQSANTAIGFKVINGVIFVQVSNGSAVTTTTTGVTMSAWLVYDCMIQSNGDGTWTATVNSTTVTGSGAPSTTSAASNAALVMSATNGTTASARRFFINNQRSMQHD